MFKLNKTKMKNSTEMNIKEVCNAIDSNEITFNNNICERCDNEYDATDPFLHTGDYKNICRKCYCEIEFSAYADGQPCDAEAVKELL